MSRRLDAVVTDRGHAILLIGQDQAVPVDGRRFRKVVLHVDRDLFAFLEAQDRARRGTVIAYAILDEVAGIDFHVSTVRL